MDNNLQILIHNFVLHSPSGLSHEFKNLFGQKNIDTLQQIIIEQEGESSAKPSDRFSTKSNPLVMTSKNIDTL